MNIEKIAKVCHYSNKAFCESFGDNSQPSWENAPDWQRDSAINGVKFHMDNPNLPDSASHDNWMQEKLNAGWVFGKIKLPEKKEHPCLVPFCELPKTQQAKDTLFVAVVRSLLPLLD